MWDLHPSMSTRASPISVHQRLEKQVGNLQLKQSLASRIVNVKILTLFVRPASFESIQCYRMMLEMDCFRTKIQVGEPPLGFT
jgi:hypothetical protein